MSLFYIHDLAIHGADFGLPVFVRIVVEEIVEFLDVVQLVLVDDLAHAAVLGVFRVGVFNHLVARFIDATINLDAVVVVFDLGGLEDVAIRFVLDDLRYQSLLVVFVLQFHAVTRINQIVLRVDGQAPATILLGCGT